MPIVRPPRPGRVRAVVLDFGGVIAEEAIYDTGYITRRGTEGAFRERLRLRTGIAGRDDALSDEILRRFALRPRMMDAVRALRRKGIAVAIPSDQTEWLERPTSMDGQVPREPGGRERQDARDRFSREFDRVFNSYRLGKGKRDATIFDDVVRDLGVLPAETLFGDDNGGHVERARSRGLAALLFRTEDAFLQELSAWTAS